MAKRDYYEILEVSKTVSPEDLKKSYRKVAMKYHPDRNPGNQEAEDKFKEAAEAYEILSNPEKRARYDRLGHSGVDMDGGFGNSGGAGFGDVFSDIFGEFFGGGGSRGGRSSTRGHRGSDLQYNMEISFEEAAFGHSTEVEIPRLETCDECGGLGAKSSKDVKVCPSCQGSGQQRIQQGFFSVAAGCSQCGGDGKVVTNPCPKCYGKTRVNRTRKIKINIPAGVDTGSRIKLNSEGEHGLNGGSPGDLYILLQVKPHAFFDRQEYDLSCEVPISFVQAILGTEIEVPTLEGKVMLKIPGGTQSHKVFRLRGKGISHLRSNSRGDLHIRVLVETPTQISSRQRELLEEFEKMSDSKCSPLQNNFLKKLKQLFS